MMDIPPPQSAVDITNARPDAFMVHLSQSKLPSFAHDQSIQSSEEKTSMFSDERLNERERALKKKDPETFMYMMILRMIHRNPDANLLNKKKRCLVTITEDPDNLHNSIVSEYKALDYHRQTKLPRNSDVINRVGVVGVEGEVDEFIQRRAEFSKYC